MKVFISYRSTDRALVSKLAEDLDELGHEVWFDRELSKQGGQLWWDNILTQLEACDLFVFALSDAALDSIPCQREYRYASALKKRILPVIIKKSKRLSDLPAELRQIQFVAYEGRTRSQTMSLAGSIARLPSANPLPEPMPARPAIPISDESRLYDEILKRLDAANLSHDEQKSLIYDIAELAENRPYRGKAAELYQRLVDHPTVLKNIADDARKQQQVLRPRTLSPVFPGVGALIAVVFIGLMIAAAPGLFGGTPSITATTAVALVVTNTSTLTPTNPPLTATPIPSMLAPSSTVLTPTSLPPTATAILPTATPIPSTLAPSSTATATRTPTREIASSGEGDPFFYLNVACTDIPTVIFSVTNGPHPQMPTRFGSGTWKITRPDGSTASDSLKLNAGSSENLGEYPVNSVAEVDYFAPLIGQTKHLEAMGVCEGVPTPTHKFPTSTPSALTYTPVPTLEKVVAQPKSSLLNVRSGLGTNYYRIGTLKQTDIVQVIGVNASLDWLVINFPLETGGRGWVQGSLVNVTGNLGSIPIIEPPPSPTPNV